VTPVAACILPVKSRDIQESLVHDVGSTSLTS
jgi:hypothetical protein